MSETTTQQQTSAIVHKLPGTSITRAFLQVQGELDAVRKDATNPHFKAKYADLPAVLAELLPKCKDAGIAIIQRTIDSDNQNVLKLETLVIHADTGEYIPMINATPHWCLDSAGVWIGSYLCETVRTHVYVLHDCRV